MFCVRNNRAWLHCFPSSADCSIFLYIRSVNLWLLAGGMDAYLPVTKGGIEIANWQESFAAIPLCRMTVYHIFPRLVTELNLRGEAATFVALSGMPNAQS